jgi:hypothetical protein
MYALIALCGLLAVAVGSAGAAGRGSTAAPVAASHRAPAAESDRHNPLQTALAYWRAFANGKVALACSFTDCGPNAGWKPIPGFAPLSARLVEQGHDSNRSEWWAIVEMKLKSGRYCTGLQKPDGSAIWRVDNDRPPARGQSCADLIDELLG